eukprot:c8428_g1_i1.p1 GENE.c8428_g1_i1~~c8428_g1_i1.p1  ORF type:complete len:237 (-),score=69.32 c8428_g1_i1:161-814(-)
MTHKLPDLTYSYDRLEPFVDTTTMMIHHSRHHNAYVNNLNSVLASAGSIASLDVTSLQSKIAALPDAIRTPVRNNGGGHYNHTFFWKVMGPPTSCSRAPYGELKEAIEKKFGAVDAMKSEFDKAAATRFGSGWAWLCIDERGELFVTSTPNQDNPLMKGIAEKTGVPLLGLDVWEHAYYLKYQNKRPEYIAAFWNVVNWDQVVENYNTATKQGKANL